MCLKGLLQCSSGIHHKNENCGVSNLTQIQENLKNQKKFLFPNEITFLPGPTRKRNDAPRANGGWSDLRDISLCLTITLM